MTRPPAKRGSALARPGLWAARQRISEAALPRLMAWSAAAGLLILWAWHARQLWLNAVDAPYWDDWEALSPEALPAGFSWGWVYARHNESRMVATKLQLWLLYGLTGWNLALQQAVNFVLYGLGLATLTSFARRALPDLGLFPLCGFLAFALSPLYFETHTIGIQSCFHFSLLFFLGALQALFREPLGTGALASGLALAWLGMNSHASGFVSCGVLLAGFCAYKASLLAGPARRREAAQFAAAAAALVLGAGLWLSDYQKNPGHPPGTSPASPLFWRFFANIVSFGFGMDQLSMTLGLFCLAVILAPLWGTARESRPWPLALWAVGTAVAAVLSVLAGISFARAAMGLEWAKSSRYGELAVILLPLSAMAWHIRLRDKPRTKARALACLWILGFLGFSGNWDFSIYGLVAAQRRRGLECLKRHYQGQGPPLCPDLYPFPLAEKLEQAKKLSVSFYRGISGSGAGPR